MYSLLKISPYNFTDEKTGDIIKGAKLTLMSQSPTDKTGCFGFDVSTENISYEMAQEFIKTLPSDIKFPVSVDVFMTVDLSSKNRVKISGIRLAK